MRKSKLKIIFIIFAIYFVLDLSLTNLIFKKTQLWKSTDKVDHYWRIKSEIYHHDLMSNIDVIEHWQIFNLRLVTNSIGFRDFEKKKIEKVNKEQKRVLLLGDSFIEGSGYDYKYTIGGLIQNKLGDKFEVLNGAVGSYSPGIYYLKAKHYIDQGYKFDYALVFLDVSDIYDELFLDYSKDKSKIINYDNIKPIHKRSFYKVGDFLTTNTLLFRCLLLLSDQTEVLKNYIKLKYKASKEFNKPFFKTTKEDTLFFRMLTIDRGYWTFNEKTYFKVKDGLKKSDYFLKNLYDLFEKNNIKSYLIIYPWPTQIYFGDNKHNNFWIKFSKDNKINLINLYDKFKNDNARKSIFDNFINGDIHWNKKGTKLVFNEIIKIRITIIKKRSANNFSRPLFFIKSANHNR